MPRMYLPQTFSGELLTDPYTSEPLRYAVRANGYVLYSLGPDQQGAPVAPRGQPTAYDVAFTVGTREGSTGD